ncbi:ATP-binding cassette sub-family B member 5 [Manis javanica]|nr:ATP-binding cassette sub-family B member 5 [Manis javanica]
MEDFLKRLTPELIKEGTTGTEERLVANVQSLCLMFSKGNWLNISESKFSAINKINHGMGGKIALLFQNISTFSISLAIGLMKGWKLTLVFFNVIRNSYCIEPAAPNYEIYIIAQGAAFIVFQVIVKISVDRNDIRTLNVQHYREHNGVVSQEPVLYGTTSNNNIKYG